MGKMKQAKVALITGITGQDGSYLAELLLKKNYIWSMKLTNKMFWWWFELIELMR